MLLNKNLQESPENILNIYGYVSIVGHMVRDRVPRVIKSLYIACQVVCSISIVFQVKMYKIATTLIFTTIYLALVAQETTASNSYALFMPRVKRELHSCVSTIEMFRYFSQLRVKSLFLWKNIFLRRRGKIFILSFKDS